jgi:DNA modification methylase
MQVERRPVASLRPSARNPRRHDDAQIAKIGRSIEAFGFNNPVLIDPTGEIIAGEARWLAAKLRGDVGVPIIVLAHLTPAQRDAYRVADNRLALDATWDDALLAQILRAVPAADFDIDIIGFSEPELAALLDPKPPAPDADADSAQAPPTMPVTRLGDIWQLGEHRLVCGDSTKRETLALLFDPDTTARLVLTDPPYGMEYEQRLHTRPADLLVTDPPYGMAYEGGRARAEVIVTDPPYGMSFGAGKEAGSTAKGAKVKAHGMILGDDVRGEDLVALVRDALQSALAFARPAAAIYVCLTWRTYADFERALAQAGLQLSACIVWDKGSIGLGFANYRPQHEFLFYAWRQGGERPGWFGGMAESDVWTVSRGATGEYVHPTQKPVQLLERAIANSSRPGDIVLDVFGGSGSTLIACERTKRRARLVELDPKYCDAIVRRWEEFTGRQAVHEQ